MVNFLIVNFNDSQGSSKNSKAPDTKIAHRNKKIDKGQVLSIKNINGLTLDNIDISSGELYIENCSNSIIRKLVAPSSVLVVRKSKTNLKFEQVSVKEKIEDQ